MSSSEDVEKELDEFTGALTNSVLKITDDEGYKKAKSKMLDDIWESIQYQVIDNMAETLQDLVLRMSSSVVTEMLEGREDQMIRYLHLDQYTGRDRDHCVIRGTLFEPGPIELRKKIAKAHADLISNERIKDLESQVTSLVEEISKRDAELDRQRGVYDGY